MQHVAMISVHGSPFARFGGREAGGMNVYVRELSRQLGRRGVMVDVFTRWEDPAVPQIVTIDDGARLIHLKAGDLGKVDKNEIYFHLPEFFQNLRRFKEEQNLRYDVLASHYWLSGWVASRLQHRWQVPHVAMFHTLGQVKNRARLGERESNLRIDTERRIIRLADKVIAATPHEKGLMQRLYGAAPSKIAVVPCGVDLERFRPVDRTAARAGLGLSDERVVLFVGRIEPLKGLDILLSAIALLEDKGNLRLLVVGGDGVKDRELLRLQAMAKGLDIGQIVSFMGPVEHTVLPEVYAAADICVVPSYYESFGMVALEAMACGKPVIASRVGGLQSTVRDGETGFLIPWRCPEPFAERLELLLTNDLLREQFGRAARREAQRYSWDVVSESVLDVYESLGSPVGHGRYGSCCGGSTGKHHHHHHKLGSGAACCTA